MSLLNILLDGRQIADSRKSLLECLAVARIHLFTKYHEFVEIWDEERCLWTCGINLTPDAFGYYVGGSPLAREVTETFTTGLTWDNPGADKVASFCWGGGAGGGTASVNGGGGGGGGEFRQQNGSQLLASDSLTIVVAASVALATNGNLTSVKKGASTLSQANGGIKGANGAAGGHGAGGAGGSGGVGAAVSNLGGGGGGPNGGVAINGGGGGGGAGSGVAANGGTGADASTQTGGLGGSPDGGNGGNGATTGAGQPGVAPGGGGGGASTTAAAGAGARGQAQLVYTLTIINLGVVVKLQGLNRGASF